MTDAHDLAVWLAVLVGALAVAGSSLTLIGSIGLLRFRDFFQRIHAPTLGTTLGGGTILIASMFFFSTIDAKLAAGEILIAIVLILTTPVSFIVLAMAARQRTRATIDPAVEGSNEHE